MDLELTLLVECSPGTTASLSVFEGWAAGSGGASPAGTGIGKGKEPGLAGRGLRRGDLHRKERASRRGLIRQIRVRYQAKIMDPDSEVEKRQLSRKLLRNLDQRQEGVGHPTVIPSVVDHDGENLEQRSESDALVSLPPDRGHVFQQAQRFAGRRRRAVFKQEMHENIVAGAELHQEERIGLNFPWSRANQGALQKLGRPV